MLADEAPGCGGSGSGGGGGRAFPGATAAPFTASHVGSDAGRLVLTTSPQVPATAAFHAQVPSLPSLHCFVAMPLRRPVKVMKKCSAPRGGKKVYTHLTQTEVALAKRWREAGKSLGECASLLGRSKEAVLEHTTPATATAGAGRPQRCRRWFGKVVIS